MTEKYRFFNSTETDPRDYQASEYADYFATLVTNGVWAEELDALEVTGHGGEMKTIVAPGKAFINGYYYENDAPLEMVHAAAHSLYDRIDRVVLRLDTSLENRFLKAFVLQGTPGDAPAPPTLTRKGQIYEISIAQVLIPAGQSYVETANITDERADASVCGYARYKTKPEWYPSSDVPNDAWAYILFRQSLSASDISDIEANSTLMDIIKKGTLGLRVPQVKTASYSMSSDDNMIVVQASSADVAITLPPADECIYREIVIKRLDSTTYTVTVDTSDGADIDGFSSAELENYGDSRTFVSDGTDWYII